MARSAVFLDRDGVIIENRKDYVRSWKQVRFLPKAMTALRHLATSEYLVILVTNQSVVGRRIISYQEALEINRRIVAEIEANGGRVDRCYLCPHRPDDQCRCRKPSAWFLQEAARDLRLDLASSFMVGDAVTDIETAHAAGVRSILVLTGLGKEHLGSVTYYSCKPVIASDLEAAVEHILAKKVMFD